MRPLGEQNYYELLEVMRDGTSRDVERAYRIARATYQPSSLATYSVYSEEESGDILRRIEEAYAVLSDDRLRREYDTRLDTQERRVRDAAPTPPPPPIPEPIRRAPRASTQGEFELDGALEPQNGVYTGAELRRIRMGLGIELEEISSITKISERFLEAIEADQIYDLPPPVYVRCFLREVAKCLGVDPASVIDTYMRRSDRDSEPA